jgi:hypothetical protein
VRLKYCRSWIRFHADLKIAVLIKELRKELDKLMAQKIASPEVDLSASPVITVRNLPPPLPPPLPLPPLPPPPPP